MSLPFYPMYPDDFEADTAHLTFAEDGAYNRLLRLCWRTPGCKVPADEDWIFRKMRAHSDEDREIVRIVLREFFTTKAGKIFNVRLLEEWQKAESKHNRRVSAGSKGGRAKALKRNKTTSSKALAKPYQPEPEPEPHKEPPKSPEGDGDLFGLSEVKKPEPTPLNLLSEVVPEELAKSFIEFRKHTKAPLTLHGAKLIAKELRKFNDPVGSINQSIMNGWKGVFEVKNREGSGKPAERVGDDGLTAWDRRMKFARDRAARQGARH